MNKPKDFGYTDPRDIEWAERTSRTSKSGLPYGTSPSQKDMWVKAQWERDKSSVYGIVIMVGFFAIVMLSMLVHDIYLWVAK